MIHLANALIAGNDRGWAEDLLGRLERKGYRGRALASGVEAVAMARGERPDIVVIGPELQDMDPTEAARAVKESQSSYIPVFLICRELTPELMRRAMEAGVDDAMALPVDDFELLARMRPLVRLGTMHTELRQRSAVAREMGVEVPDFVDARIEDRHPILFVGHDFSDFAALCDGSVDRRTTDNIFEAEDIVSGADFDAAILLVDDQDDLDSRLSFCAKVRNNPRLFNLPVVVVDGIGIDAAEAYRRGATRVVRRPVQPVLFPAVVWGLVQRQRARWALRRALDASLAPATRDPLTGSYNRDFLMRYLDRRTAAAQIQGRHLTVVFFHIPGVEGVREQFGDEAAEHLQLQLAQWIQGLLRVEDVTARYEGSDFCVVLPDTPMEEAQVVMNRIAGVLDYTDFAVREVYQPVKVWVEVGSAQLAPEDDVAAVLARARRNID